MKRYLKEHKIVVVATILMLIIIVIAFFVKQAFFSNSGNAVYGDRLDGIETVNDDVGLDTAKLLSSKVLEKLDEDQKKFYDIQVFVKKDTDAKDFPIIGYKQNNKESFAWTKDRSAE